MQPVFERVFTCSGGQFVDEAFTGIPHLQRIHRPHPAQRHRRVGNDGFERNVWDGVDERRLIREIRIDTIHRLRALLSINRRPNDAMSKCNRPAVLVERSAEFVQADRTIGGAAHVVFARPDDLYRRVYRLRDQRSLDRVVVLEPSAETSAEQSDIDFDLFGLQAEQRRDGVPAILRNLRGRPDFTFRSAEVCGAVARLHRSMGHEGELIRGLDLSSRRDL